MSKVEAMLLDPKLLIYLFHLAVVASVVCLAGLLAVRLCRHGPAPLRHGILAGTLVLVLVSPGAVWVGQRSGPTWGDVTVAGQADVAEHLERVSSTSLRKPGSARGVPTVTASKERLPAAVRGISATIGSAPGAATPAESVADRVSPAAAPAASPAGAVRGWQLVGTVLALAWMAGSCLQLIRLGFGWRALGRFCRCLEEVAEPRIKAMAGCAAEAVARRDPARVFLCPSAPAPFCLGLIHPVIVVPRDILEELDDDQLQAVLIHETAHLVRRDTWVSLGQRMAVLLFWWNPLVHRVRGQLADLREDICDNYVCRTQREGRRFAEALVGLAVRTTAPRLLPATLGILEPAGLMGRVHRLLNKERNMATCMGPASKAIVLAWTGVVFTAILLGGGLRVVYSATEAQRTAKAAGESPQAATAEQPITPGSPPAPETAVEKALAKEVRLEFRDTPLEMAALHFQKVLGIPVLLDQRALEEVGIASDMPFTIAVSGITAESALRLMLRDEDLVAMPGDEILLITTPDRAAESLTVRVYEVSDLVAQDQEPAKLDSLIAVITSTVEPTTWNAVGGPGAVAQVGRTLVISQTRAAQGEAARLLDALREMQTGKSAGPLWVMGKAERRIHATIREKLGRLVQADFVNTPLGEVASRIGKEWDMPVLIDRRALDEVGIVADTPITLRVQGVPARTVLERILQPHDLTWMISSEVLLITTPDRAAENLLIRVYNVGDLSQEPAKTDQIIRAITSTILPTTWDAVGGAGQIAAFQGRKSTVLVISQTDEAHERIERLLASLGP